jgi:DNA-binding Xre family transcriptional regulator
MKKITLKDFFKSVIAQKGMTIKSLAESSGKSEANVSTILSKGKLSMTTFEQLMNGCGEEVTIILKDGNKYSLKINK